MLNCWIKAIWKYKWYTKLLKFNCLEIGAGENVKVEASAS